MSLVGVHSLLVVFSASSLLFWNYSARSYSAASSIHHVQSNPINVFSLQCKYSSEDDYDAT
jgi:hypothetical protein